MRKLLSLAVVLALTTPVLAAEKDIVDTAVSAGSFKTLAAALQAADLVDTLRGSGPFTVLAPTDDAFAKLPAGTVENLVKPENKATLTKILTYHVVPGRLSSADLMKTAAMGAGKNMLKTVEGEPLTVTAKGGAVWLTDAKGGTSKITIANVNQSNGVIHVVDTVLMP